MPNFAQSKGAAVAESASKSGRDGVEFFSVKESSRAYVRPLTDIDGLLTVQVHMGVPTKPGPKDATSWPQQMSAVCQNDPAFIDHIDESGEEPATVYEEGYGHCYIHENMQDVAGKFKTSVAKTRAQTWGLFALREVVMEGGRPIGFRDVMETYTDADGKTHSIPKIVVASQSYGNFWGAFVSAGFMSQSMCDKDFSVERTGSADYTISPGRETPDHQPGTESWGAYEHALKLRDLSVERVIVCQSSPKYYGKFFDPSVKSDEESAEGTAEEGQPAGADTISAEQAAETRAKMSAAFGTTQPT